MIDNFINYISYVKHYSQATVINYKKWLKKLDTYLTSIWKNIDDPESIKIVDIYNLMEDMSKSWLQPRTCAWHIYGIISYLRYCKNIVELDILDIDKIHTPKIPERKIWYYSEEEKKLIIDYVKKWFWDREETRIRNKLLVYLLLHTWLRCHEIAKIKLNDLVGESLQIVGKWWSRRFVYLRKEILDLRYLYLWKRKRNSSYLFSGYKGEHLTTDQIRHTLEKIWKAVGVHVYPHKFRHTCATDLLHVDGSNIYAVAKILWHKKITTTQIYLWTNNTELKKIQFWLKFN